MFIDLARRGLLIAYKFYRRIFIFFPQWNIFNEIIFCNKFIIYIVGIILPFSP